ncbi:MAG: hypothetical protein KC561_02245 [Myxococcales bacterium]|nr:hypothetical protein [Myxococcales bacterium]
MPVLLDVPGLFVAGSAIAHASRKRIETTGAYGESRYVRSALVVAILYSLSTLFLAFWREDWMWSYLLRPPVATMVWYLIFAAVLCGAAWLGALLTQRALRRGQRLLAYGYLLIPFLMLVGGWLALADQYTHIGTYDEYHAGRASAFMPDTWRVVFISIAVNATVLIAVAIINRRLDSRDAKGET